MMSVMPLVRSAVALARQIGTDASCAEHLRHVVNELSCLADRAPFVGIAIDGSHELRMAVPTAFANVDSPAEILDLRAMRRRDHLAIHVFHCFRPG